jgi:transposase
VTGDGHVIPPRLKCEVERELQRLALVDEQLAITEVERDQVARQCEDSENKRRQLTLLRGIGETGAAILVREVFYRTFSNRRQVGSYLGLAPCPYDSGSSTRSQGISKAGNARARSTMIELAWFWLRYQPDSQLTLWFEGRVKGQSKRIRRIMIVALARKLAVAFWRYLETGLVPSGATVANA